MKTLTIKTKMVAVIPSGNWNTAKDHFPIVDVNQQTGEITLEVFETYGRQEKASISSVVFDPKISADQSQVLISGEVDCRNCKNYKCTGTQKFVYAIFEGDSGHIYIHRAPATKGWINCDPNLIRKRLVKLGIGATEKVLQQGDYLLKPANGNAQPVEFFRHEWTSSSHHKFSEPLLSEFVSGVGRVIYVPGGKTVELHHEAVDGIQHPMIIVPAGQWVIGSTASQLNHSNIRD